MKNNKKKYQEETPYCHDINLQKISYALEYNTNTYFSLIYRQLSTTLKCNSSPALKTT